MDSEATGSRVSKAFGGKPIALSDFHQQPERYMLDGIMLSEGSTIATIGLGGHEDAYRVNVHANGLSECQHGCDKKNEVDSEYHGWRCLHI